jgi:hypothetical protein
LAIGPLAQVCLRALTIGGTPGGEQATGASVPAVPSD